MRLPRDLTGEEFSSVLGKLGYRIVRQTGSHMRMVTLEKGEHHLTVPRHKPMRLGTVAGILGEVAEHFGVGREVLVEKLFGDR